MSLSHFQRALAELTLDAERAAALRRGHLEVLRGFELTERELARLEDVVRQPGMSLNCTLARANRLGPIFDIYPMLCLLLEPRLREVLDAFWRERRPDNYQLENEAARFAEFVRSQLSAGEDFSPYLADVLAYESACWELVSSARHGGPELETAETRTVVFHHDPRPLLASLAELQPPPEELAAGLFPVSISLRDGELRLELVPPLV
ncbi:hypothetical protein [Archangium lansingense]|uniref:DNA-binding domain-containing protein n=1 Tax=Archangium lansingense TaxID=2995310 RepID=A0ABT4AME7_9BACT|nr:hypothetical protein [Archangium lansinium]MCY1082857.1 hypothetical protein [Archangium lansinium]